MKKKELKHTRRNSLLDHMLNASPIDPPPIAVVGKIVRLPNGIVVDLRFWGKGGEVLALVDSAWVKAVGNPDVPWEDLKDARVLTGDEIAALPTQEE